MTRENEAALSDGRIRDRPGEVDAVGRGGGVDGQGGAAERARVEDAAPPALALAAPEDRVRAALGERLDDPDRAVRQEHRRRGGREDALRKALRRDARRGEAAVRVHPHEVERRVLARFLDRVGDGRPARSIDREARDAQQRSFRGVPDVQDAPAAARADDEADPGAAALDEHGIPGDARHAAVQARQGGDRGRTPGRGARAGRDHQPAAVDPRDARRSVARDPERSLGHARSDDLGSGRGRGHEGRGEKGDEEPHAETVSAVSRLDITTLTVHWVRKSRNRVFGVCRGAG